MTAADLALLHGAAFTMPRPWTAAEFADLMASPLVFLLNAPGGFVMGRVVADEAELLTIAVAPDRRGRGIAWALMQRFLDELAHRNAAHVFLEVAQSNAPARALYRKAGFSDGGLRRGYYHDSTGHPFDAIVMTRRI